MTITVLVNPHSKHPGTRTMHIETDAVTQPQWLTLRGHAGKALSVHLAGHGTVVAVGENLSALLKHCMMNDDVKQMVSNHET